MDISGKVAVITGGASGLGLAAAESLWGAGAEVICLDLADEFERPLNAGSAGISLRHLDVSDGEALHSVFQDIESEYGRLEICVNAAGVSTAAKVLSDTKPMTRDLFARVIDVNLVGAFDSMRHAADIMRKGVPEGRDGERGVVINVSSGAAFQGQKGQVAYAASKAGLVGMMLPAARDLGELGIRVMTIAPGLFQTSMAAGLSGATLQGIEKAIVFPNRLGSPAEFARLVCSIVENSYLNAETFNIDAGVRLT